MKNNNFLHLTRKILCSFVILFYCVSGFTQSTGIILTELNIPETIEENTFVAVSGTFKNEGATVYNGSLGLHLQVKDTPESNYGVYYSNAINSVGIYSLAPGEEGAFTTIIYIVPSLFNAVSKDVIIILPKIGNESQPSTTNCITKELQVNFQN